MIRLSKYLHQCGLGSRNQCEDLIHSNRIKVNDILVREPFTRVSENDKVQLDDQILETQKDKLYFLLNKPKGFSCMTTTEDQKVSDLVSHLPYRLFTVGFLDVQAEGLIFLTNDGDFTHRMSASEIEKEYLIQVDQPLTKEHLMLLSEGNPIDEASFIPPLHVSKVGKDLLKIVIQEGKRREVRYLLRNAQLEPLFVQRVRIGPFKLEGLSSGEFKPFNPLDLF